MSDNDSFIDEVTEEVRRDKLYLFLKRYGWMPVILILAAILASVFIEVKSEAEQTSSEELGDFLSQSLNQGIGDSSKDKDERLYTIDSKSLVALMLEAKVFENKLEYKMAILKYETILLIDNMPNSLRDFIKFKLLLLVKDDPIRIKKLFVDLINPDSPFNLLALEQKILMNINNREWKEAMSNINLLIADPAASQAMVSRVTQIKKAIKLDSL